MSIGGKFVLFYLAGWIGGFFSYWFFKISGDWTLWSNCSDLRFPVGTVSNADLFYVGEIDLGMSWTSLLLSTTD